MTKMSVCGDGMAPRDAGRARVDGALGVKCRLLQKNTRNGDAAFLN
jgi:hypothetical protein